MALSTSTTLTNLHAKKQSKSASVLFFIKLSTPYENYEAVETLEPGRSGHIDMPVLALGQRSIQKCAFEIS